MAYLIHLEQFKKQIQTEMFEKPHRVICLEAIEDYFATSEIYYYNNSEIYIGTNISKKIAYFFKKVHQ